MRAVLILSVLFASSLAQSPPPPLPANCATAYLATDNAEGCKVCNSGYVPAVGPKPVRLLSEDLRFLQGPPAKTYYICQKSSSSSIAFCDIPYTSEEAFSGCKQCRTGYGRAVGTPKLRLLEDSRLMQGTVKTYYECKSCTISGCGDCGSVLNTQCLSCKDGFRELPAPRILEEYLRIT